MQRKGTLLLGALMFSVVIGATACTTERDPIDRSPKESLDKKMFEGEFFYKQTLVDMPYTVDYSFIGESNALKIIRWEIQKKWLIAYNIHDEVDTYYTDGESAPNRTPILAFPILDHFDITYMDNPTTGEDMPVITANHDRDWSEARYFIIDPSTSYVTNFEMEYLNITVEWDNPFYREPVAGYTELEFYDKAGNYLDPRDYQNLASRNPVHTLSFKTQEIFTPNNSWYGWWRWDDVWEGIYWFINWEPARITYRHHFMAVDRAEIAGNGFVPVDAQDPIFRKFGYFRSNTADYCTDMGVRDMCYHKWANYYNITGDHTVTIRMAPSHPKHLIPSVCSMVAEYNDTMTRAKYALEHDGSDVAAEPDPDPAEDFANWLSMDPEDQHEMLERCLGTAPGVDHAWGDANDAADMVKLRPQEFVPYVEARDGYDMDGFPVAIDLNPCAYYPQVALPYVEDATGQPVYTYQTCFPEGANVDFSNYNTGLPLFRAACQKDWTSLCKESASGEKLVRYAHELGSIPDSFIYWVDQPTEYGILGVSQWTSNPETGETLGGASHIAGWVVYWVRQYGLDLFDLHAGQKDIDDIMNPDYGQPISKVTRTVKMPWHGPNGETSAAFTPEQMAQWEMDIQNRTAKDASQELTSKWHALSDRLPLEAIDGTMWESTMTPQSLKDFIFPGMDALDESHADYVSPLSYMTADAQNKIMQKQQLLLEGTYLQAEFMDGVVAKYVEEKMKDVQALEDAGYDFDTAYQTVRETISDEMDAMVFYGTAIHEAGHTFGLRHNFKGSADERSYVGNAPWEAGEDTGYWAEKPAYQAAIDAFVQENPNATGREIYEFSRSIKSDRDMYMYSSVMDYQSQYFIHTQGLGKYDKAAFKFMYGKSVEKYTTNTGENAGILNVKNAHWIDPTTNEIKIEKDTNTLVYNEASNKYIVSPALDTPVEITENGDTVPYFFKTDHQRTEDPMANIFDHGYTAREQLRFMVDSWDARYYYRFFRRGNPKFMRDFNWFSYFWTLLPMAHYALDFQYNLFFDKEWQKVITDNFGSSTARKEYIAAVQGREYLGTSTNRTEFEPGFVGDMVVAGMEGFNFLLYDIIYRPDVDAYLMLERDEDPTIKYFVKNPYINDAATMEAAGYDVLYVGADVGRYHRNRWDIQDDPRISEPKRLRHGYSVAKDAAIFVLSNTGWPIEKYGRENMANAFHYVAQGFYNSLTTMISNVINEDSMITFSPYCGVLNAETNKYEMVKMDIPYNATFLWGAPPEYGAPGNSFQPPTVSLCENIGGVPLHAGWQYFDKLTPSYYLMYSMSNVTADMSVFELFTPSIIDANTYDPSHCIQGGDMSGCGNVLPLDTTKEAEFLSVNGRFYYRGHQATTLYRTPTPVFELIKRASALRAMCGDDMFHCDQRNTLEHMEATLINNTSFANFWTTIWAYYL